MLRPISSKHLLVVFLLCAAAFGQRRPSAPEAASISVAAMAPVPGAAYAGADRCRTCHQAEFQEFSKTHHAAIKPVQPDSVTGCEMCHGPGKAHADAQEASQGDDAKTAAANKLIFSFQGESPRECRALPGMPSEQPRSERFHALPHIQHGVACNSCHSIHLVEAGRNPQAERLGTAQGNFFNVPKLPEENRWLHNSQLIKPAAGIVLWMPRQHPGPVRFAHASSRSGRRDEVYRLPQYPRHFQPGHTPPKRLGNLHAVPRRKARTVCLRALRRESRRLYRVSHAARQRQRDAAGPARRPGFCACNATWTRSPPTCRTAG